jgi:protein phosphatase
VGDSRGYLLRDGELQGLTTDHTLVQSLVDEGRITEEEARVHPHRNLILKAVDGVHEPEPDLFSVPMQPGDRVLLCSDGCSGVLDVAEMARLLGTGALDEAAGALVVSALDAGSSDNVTVVLAEVLTGSATEAAEAVVVGAAAATPHRQLTDETTGNLSDGDLAALGEEDLGDVDPEELRYAPRPPRRHAWLRRSAVLLVLLALVAAGLGALYSWSQGQYYVSDDHGDVVIFKGVKANVPGVETHHVAERTGVAVADLESYDAGRVRSGITADDLADARRIVADLKIDCPEPATPPAAPSAPAATKTNKKGSAAASNPTPSVPTPTPTAATSSGATLPDPCATTTPTPAAPTTTPATTPGATP